MNKKSSHLRKYSNISRNRWSILSITKKEYLISDYQLTRYPIGKMRYKIHFASNLTAINL